MLNDQEAKELGKSLGALIAERGLGAFSKKDYDLLVFHHLAKSAALNNDSNYTLANTLKITESRVKSLRLESAIRHGAINHKAVLGNIVHRIVNLMSQPDFNGDFVFITLEDPVEKRELEYALKLANHNVEYGRNREILKVGALGLFEIILANADKAEDVFKNAVQSCIQTRERQQEILNRSLTFRQRVNKLGQEVTANGGAVSLVQAAAGLVF